MRTPHGPVGRLNYGFRQLLHLFPNSFLLQRLKITSSTFVFPYPFFVLPSQLPLELARRESNPRFQGVILTPYH